MIVSVIGDTPHEVASSIERLASCSLPHALLHLEQATLQPQGWLAGRCCAYHDGDTLWVGVAAGSNGGTGSEKALLLEEAREQDAAAARAVLLAFLTSHAVLWLQPAARLASSGAAQLLRRLRLLQQLKSLLLPGLPALLGVPSDQASAVQPGLCIPQLLLVASLAQAQAPDVLACGGILQAGQGQGQAGHVAPVQQGQQGQQGKDPQLSQEAQWAWQAAADSQLRLLFKRCGVMAPEDSARTLCTLPAAGAVPLVLLLPEPLGSGSQEQLVAAALAELTLLPATPAAATAAGGGGSQGQAGAAAAAAARVAPPLPAAAVAAALAPQRAAVASYLAASWADVVLSWRQAVATLSAVLEAASLRPKASSGSSSGDAEGSGSSSRAKAAAAGAAADVSVPPEASAAMAWQEACGDGVRQFSLASCKRAAAVASDAYRRNTPALLPAAGHAVALQAALRLYCSLARGPAAAEGERALREQLEAYWRDGHMQCDAVSFLGNPCCLPAHDPSQQPHASALSGGPRPLLLLATGSGAQQASIPEPFTVAELQRAAAAVAAEAASAAARAQFFVRHLGGPAAGQGAGALLPAAAAGAAAARTGTPAAGEAAADAAAAEQEEEEEAGGRYALSGAGHSSGEEEEEEVQEERLIGEAGSSATQAGPAAAAAVSAVGLPASGCWLELHVLGPRSEWKSAALAAALLLDGQPGWLRGGGCMFGTLPLLVAVPPRPGQQPQPQQQQLLQAVSSQGQGQEHEPQSALQEEFPSLAEVEQQVQRQKQKKKQQRPKAAAAAGPKRQQGQHKGEGEGRDGPAPLPPQLLSWPGWESAESTLAAAAGTAGGQQAQQAQRAPLFMAPTAAGKQQRAQAGRQRGGRPQQQQGRAEPKRAADAAVAAGVGGAGLAAAAAAAVAAGAAVVEQATLLVGFEYESVQGHRLLLTPALLAAAVQSSLDTVSVRQHAPQPAPLPTGPGPRTAAATAAAVAAAPSGPAGAAAFLLQQDLPLWLQLPGEQLASMAGKRRGGPGGAAAHTTAAPAAAGERSVAAMWLQLRRVLVGTPDVAVPLVADPCLVLEVPREMLAPAGVPARSTASTAGSSGVSSAVQLRYGLAGPLTIPAGSFCILALPWLLTAPMASEGSSGGGGAGGSSSGPAALIRQSGPLRAVLAGGSAVRPGTLQAP